MEIKGKMAAFLRKMAPTGINTSRDSERVGANSLREILDQVGLVGVPAAVAEEDREKIIDAYERLSECKACKKVGADLEACYSLSVEFDGAHIRLTSGPCRRQRQYYLNRKMARIMQESSVGKRFQSRRFQTFEVTMENRAAYEKCESYVKAWPGSGGLLMVGGYGTGKTHMAAAILFELMKKGVCGVFIVAPDLLRRMKDGYNSEDAELRGLFDTVMTAEFLVLDDLGAEKASEWAKEQMFILINSRYENMLPTVITTNYEMKQLREMLGQRIISRIVEMCDGVQFGNVDWRMKKLS